MSMEDARLDHQLLRIEAIERALGMSDDPPECVTTIVSRLEAAEEDISALEAGAAAAQNSETWVAVKDLVLHRDHATGDLTLSYRCVKALADLIEGEWGKQA